MGIIDEKVKAINAIDDVNVVIDIIDKTDERGNPDGAIVSILIPQDL